MFQWKTWGFLDPMPSQVSKPDEPPFQTAAPVNPRNGNGCASRKNESPQRLENVDFGAPKMIKNGVGVLTILQFVVIFMGT